MRHIVFALSAALCLTASPAAPLEDVIPEDAEVGVNPVHLDEISNLRSHFKEDAGVDVSDEDVLHLLEGAARFAMTAEALEEATPLPPYPIASIKAQSDVDDEPGNEFFDSA